MADTIPINFPFPTESSIASYPYTDIKEGTGVVQYMITRVQVDNSSSNDAYPLITDSGIVSAEVSGEPKTQLAASSEFNFDVTFNTPKILNGDIFCVLSFEITGSATTPKVRILKWDGSTETELVAQTTFQATASTSGQYVVTAKIPISNKKIGSGDALRIELVTTGGTSAYLLHDPTASVSGNPTGGRTSFFVPFKLLD